VRKPEEVFYEYYCVYSIPTCVRKPVPWRDAEDAAAFNPHMREETSMQKKQ
jgi:hypothetical protein